MKVVFSIRFWSRARDVANPPGVERRPAEPGVSGNRGQGRGDGTRSFTCRIPDPDGVILLGGVA